MNTVRRGLLLLPLTVNTGTYLVAQTDAATRSVSMTVDQSNLSLQPRIAVVTLTSYGWTAESPRSAVLTC